VSGSAKPVAPAQRAKPLGLSELPASAFRTSGSVRFSDCDPAGIVYTPRFVDMMNGAIEDFFPGALGLDYHHILRDRRIGLGYASVACDFFAVASMGDPLTFTTLVEHVGGASSHLVVHIHRGETEICRGRFIMVTTSLADHRPFRFEALRLALTAYQEICR
jgi:4-hydroxybenzoyl-CoA thioesterase